MSEHIVALALAAAKRLFIEHAKLKHGEFNQGSANRMLRDGVCGIRTAARRLRSRAGTGSSNPTPAFAKTLGKPPFSDMPFGG